MKHPIQPLEKDKCGVVRFRANKIVQKLLDDGFFDMNQIARWDVSNEDRMQFAQLIGYSLSGFGDLSYVDDETYSAADKMFTEKKDEQIARLEYLQELVSSVRDKMREGVAELFEKHPDDL